MYTILYIKYKTDKDLQYSTRNYTQYFAISSKGKESEKNRGVCVCVRVRVRVCVCVQLLSHVRFFINPWTAVHQAPLSMGFPRQEYWIRLPFPSPGHFPHPGLEPSPPALADRFFTVEPPGKPRDTYGDRYIYIYIYNFAVHLKLTQHCKSTLLQ